MPDGQKTEVSYDAKFEKKISRLFVFRFLWMYVEMWVLMVWGMWLSIIMFLEFWYMLIFGKRVQAFWKKKLRFMRHVARWQAYLMALTDKRPDLISD